MAALVEGQVRIGEASEASERSVTIKLVRLLNPNSCLNGSTYRRHLANTIERSVLEAFICVMIRLVVLIDKTPACDERTERLRAIAYTALAERLAVKVTLTSRLK